MPLPLLGLVGVSSYWNDIAYVVCDKNLSQSKLWEVRLKRIIKVIVILLLNHGDGKRDGFYMTTIGLLPFTRDTSGNSVWDAGLAGLLPSIAAGYYMFMDLIYLQRVWLDEP